MNPNLSTAIKLLYVPDYQKRCESLELTLKIRDSTIRGKDATIATRDNEIHRLRLKVARLEDEIRKTGPAIPGVNK